MDLAVLVSARVSEGTERVCPPLWPAKVNLLCEYSFVVCEGVQSNLVGVSP